MYFNYHIGTHLLRPSPIISNISYMPDGTTNPLPLTPGVTETSVITSPFDGDAVNLNFFNLAMSATDNTFRIATLENFSQTAISSAIGYVSYSGLKETSAEFYGGSPLLLTGIASQSSPLVLTLSNPIAFQMAVGQGIVYNQNGTINTTLSAIRSITFGGGTGASSPYYYASTLDTYLTGLLAGNTKDNVNSFRVNGTSGIGGNSSLWTSTFGSISGGNPKSFYLYVNDGYTASQNGSTLSYNPYITLSQAIPYNAGAGIYALATVLQSALNNAISSISAFTVNVINGGGDIQIVGSNDRTSGGIYQFTLQKDTVGDAGNNGILEWLQLFPVSGTSVQAWDLSSVINFQISGGLVGQTYNPFQLSIAGNGPYEYMYFIDQDNTFTIPGFLAFWGITTSATTYYHTRHPATADGFPTSYSTVLNYGGDLWVRDAYVRNFASSGSVTYGGTVTFSGSVIFSNASLTGNLTSSGNLSLTAGNLSVGGASTLVGNTFIGNSNSPSTSNTQIYGNLTIGSAGITTFNVFSAATFNSSVSFAPNTTITIGNTLISSNSINTSGSVSSGTATISSATINNLTVGTLTVTNQQYTGSSTLTTLTVTAGSTLGGLTTANYLTFSSTANTPTGGAFYSANASRTNMPTTLGSGSADSAIYNGDLIATRLITTQPSAQPGFANVGDIILGGLLWMNQGSTPTPPSTSPVFYSGATVPVNSGTTANYNGPFNAYSMSTVSALTVGGALTTTNATQIAGSFDVGSTVPAHTNRLNYDGNMYATTFFGTLVGSVQGGGGVTNYIGNGGFETGSIAPWAAYANTVAGNTPTPSAQGGTVHITLATNVSNPIFGSYDGIVGKTAANDQGNGIYYDFSLDFGALTVTNQVLTVEIVYKTGANYTSNDVALFIYDKTSLQFANLQGATISTTGVVLPSSSSPALLITSFTTINLSDTAYRLYLHIAGTNANAWSGSSPATGIEIDGIAVSWANIPIFQIAGGSNSNIGYPLYNGTTKLAGAFYGGATAPTDTSPLSYDGNFQSTNFTTPGLATLGTISVTTTTQLSGGMYAGTVTAPTHVAATLNYDGNFRASTVTTNAAVAVGGVLTIAGTTQAAGQFDVGTGSLPSNTNRMNWEGNFYANNFFSTSAVSVGTNLVITTGGTKTSGQFDGANVFPSDTAIYVNYDGYFNATGVRVAQSGAFAFASGVSTLTTSITATVPGAARTYNLPDTGSNSTFLLAATTAAVGYFDSTSTNPASGATRLNWDGSLYAYNLDAINNIVLGTGTSAITFSSSMTAASAVTFQNVAGTIPIIAAAQQSSGGFFDTSASAPIHSIRLNYDGNFYTFALTTASNLTVGGGAKTAGAFDTGGSNPTDTNRLNYDGYFYATAHFGIFGNALTGTGNVSHGTTALTTNTGNYNTAIGAAALTANTTGNYNTAVGYAALTTNTTGGTNVAIGYNSLTANSTGSSNVAVGSQALSSNTVGGYNIAVGYQALQVNTTGIANTAVGYGALASNITGTNNVAMGYYALEFNTISNLTAIGYTALAANTTGIANTAVGCGALASNTTGGQNVAMGYYALSLNTTGGQNTAIGYGALNGNLVASNNTAVGYSALIISTGINNTAVGSSSLSANTTGGSNTALGAQTLVANTTGSQNVAIGYNALTGITASSSNTAIGYNTLSATAAGPITNNTAVGANALAVNTGNNNTAVGYNALTANTTGIENSAVGNTALSSNTTGAYNVAVGYAALSGNTTGTSNVAVGITALQTASIAQYNTAIGYGALSAATGGQNTALGYNAGSNVVGGTSNVIIGYGASASSASVTNEVTITDGTNFARFQGSQTSWTFTSDERDKTNIQNAVIGLDFLMKVQPKTYIWKHRSGAISDGTIQLEFTAQSLDAAESTLPFPIGLVSKADPEQWTIAQTALIPVLVNSIKELKAEVDELKKQLAAK